MSLLDIYVTRDRATVAADSLAYSHEGGVRYWPDGTPMHVAKIVSLPQATAVLTGRGKTLLFAYLQAALSQTDVAASRRPGR